jgi:hypothetical protein
VAVACGSGAIAEFSACRVAGPVILQNGFICASLDTAGEAEFGLVQKQLDLSASALSKHVTMLMDAGYVGQRKAVRDTRQRVWPT